jgi:hypothetical protein
MAKRLLSAADISERRGVRIKGRRHDEAQGEEG